MKLTHLALAVAAILPTLELNATAHSAYLAESLDYSGHGCVYNPPLTTLPYNLNALAASLTSAKWTNVYWAQSNDWPQDFVDGCMQPDGFDIADDRDLVVEVHHGYVGNFVFGYSHNSRCGVSLKNDMRLGSMAGATASTAVLEAAALLTRTTSRILPIGSGPARTSGSTTSLSSTMVCSQIGSMLLPLLFGPRATRLPGLPISKTVLGRSRGTTRPW